jgi:hypothetical protein
MKKTESANQKDSKNQTQQTDTVEVLYQKMGDRWFAFSLIDDEVFMGSIPQSEIDASLLNDGVSK